MKESIYKREEIKKVCEEKRGDTVTKKKENGSAFWCIFFISSMYIVSVSVACISDKFIFLFNVENPDNIKHFERFMHPMILVLNMFAGMSLWNIIYFGKRMFQKNSRSLPPLKFILLMCIPSFIDNLFTTILLYGKMLTAQSISRCLNSMMLIGNMVMCYFFLKAKFTRNNLMGAVFILIGSSIVGFAAISAKSLGETSVLGLSTTVFYYFFCNIQLVFEEYLLKGFKNIDLDPMLLVGVEGITGVVYSCGLILVGNMIPCTPIGDNNYALCAYNYIENISIAFQQIRVSPNILLYFFWHLISLALFHIVALNIIKIINSTFRSILVFVNVILVWIHSVLMGWETLKPLQVLGYSIIIIGVLVFQKIVNLIKSKEEISEINSKAKPD